MTYSAMSRENALGWKARREPTSMSAQSVLALRIVSLFRLSGVARRLQTAAGMRPPRALERRKMDSNAAGLSTSSGS